MGDSGSGVITWVLVVAGLVLAVISPVVVWRGVRSPERATEHWLDANARPGWAVVGYSLFALLALGLGTAGTLLAVYRYSFMWVVTALAVSGFICLGISIRAALRRIPHEGDDSE